MGDTIIQIANHLINDNEKCFVIAEIAQAHDGSLGMAHAYIDAAAQAGADAIKFQTHIAAAESTKDETFRIPMSGQDATRYDYWKRMEFSQEQWVALSEHAAEAGLMFLSSAFSIEAVMLLDKIGMPAWKVGSGEFRSTELLDAMMQTGKPILFSTGMSRYEEVDEAVSYFRSKDVDFGLFQCTSKYPTDVSQVGLNVIDEYKNKYGCPVGLSDHSGTVHPAIAAISRGVNMIELHVTFDKGMYGPDTAASVTFDELKFICEHADAAHTMLQNPVDKNKMANDLQVMRELFTKSIAFNAPQKAGTVIEDAMLAPKKPGTGIPYSHKDELIGLILKKDVSDDRLLKWEDVIRDKA